LSITELIGIDTIRIQQNRRSTRHDQGNAWLGRFQDKPAR
jgi:hypothetical protein